MITEILLPQWGMSMLEGVVVQWYYEVGQLVEEGEPVVEVEAEKVTSDVLAPATGVLESIDAPPDTVVPVRGRLGTIRGK